MKHVTSLSALWHERDNRLLVLLGTAPVLYMFYSYGGSPAVLDRFLGPQTSDLVRVGFSRALALLVLGLVPCLIIKLGFREGLGEYGIGSFRFRPSGFQFPVAGFRFNLLFVLIGSCVTLLVTWLTSQSPEFRAVYPEVRSAIGSGNVFLLSSLFYLLYYVGYEVFFRGYLLFGIAKRLGNWPAILVTTLATSLVHINRPMGEYAVAVLAGFVFGYVALRTRSIWGVFLVHALAGVSLDFFCSFR